MRITSAFCAGLFLCMILFNAGAASAQFGESTQFFPHFALGGGWITIFTIHNTSTSPITVRIQMFRSDGSSLLTQDVALGAGATKTVNMEQAPVLTTGWAKLTSADRFSGTELFQLLGTGGQLISEAGVLPSTLADQFKLFGTVQNQLASGTGIAVANPSATSEAVLTVRRFDASGMLRDTRTVRLAPLQQLARFLNEEPYFVGLDNYEGIVEITATQPVTAVTLRLDGSQVASVGVITPQSVVLTSGSVTTDHLTDGLVTTAKLSTAAVTEAKLESGAVTTSKVADAAVTNTKLADGAVTGVKVAAGQVVKSINSLKDEVTLTAGANVTITPSGNTITIAAATGGTSSGLTLPFTGSVAAGNLASAFDITNTAATSGQGITGTGSTGGTGVKGIGGASGGIGIQGSGRGSAAGVEGTGGDSNGVGIRGTGGSITGGTGGTGVAGYGGGSSGTGVFALAAGDGAGLRANGGPSGGNGAAIIGGAGSGFGVVATGGTPNGIGLLGQGQGTGAGIRGTGGTSHLAGEFIGNVTVTEKVTTGSLQVDTNGTEFSLIQAGTATLGSSSTAATTYTISFPKTFSAAPKVIVTVRGGNFNDTFVASTRSISTSQFVINVVRVDAASGWAQGLQLDWMAWQ